MVPPQPRNSDGNRHNLLKNRSGRQQSGQQKLLSRMLPSRKKFKSRQIRKSSFKQRYNFQHSNESKQVAEQETYCFVVLINSLNGWNICLLEQTLGKLSLLEYIFLRFTELSQILKSLPAFHGRCTKNSFQMTRFGTISIVQEGWISNFKAQELVYHLIGSLLYYLMKKLSFFEFHL